MPGVFTLLMLVATAVSADAIRVSSRANPIRKVVTMLQNMQTKITTEGEHAEELFEKYMCYCKTGGKTLSDGIEAAKVKIPQLEAAIKGAAGEKAQLESDLKEHKADREAALKAMAEATAIREKEKAAFEKATADDKANVNAMVKAIAAIEKGMGGSFIQTFAGQGLKKFVQTTSRLEESDRQDVLAFLSGSNGYAPQAGQIVGILKQMHDEVAEELRVETEAEDKAVAGYDKLIIAKKKEVAALTKSIEVKLERVGALGVKTAEQENDLEDTKEGLAEDEKFLADLEKNCKTKESEFAEIKKMRAEELLALADTIKVLNDDDTLELMKKTLPSASASFMQVEVTAKSMRARALDMITAGRKKGDRLGFIALALKGKKVGFEKIITMIDDLVATLGQEQKDDDAKKTYCGEELDKSDDEKKSLERNIADLETAIADAKEGLTQLADELAALKAGIISLDKSVAEATDQRKEEHAAYDDLVASDTAAKEILLFAKNRLNKFYNPKLYKAPPKRELSEEDRIVVNNGGTLAPTNAPAGIAGTGITVLAQDAPPAAPEAPKAFEKSSEQSNGVLAMIDGLVKELEKELTVAGAEEKDAQGDYEQAMSDAKDKRAQDSKTLDDKEGAQADLKADLEKHEGDKKSSEKELGATLATIHSLHNECDWLLQYFDVRAEARANEVDALGKAKAVLSGADYSLVQQTTRHAAFLKGF